MMQLLTVAYAQPGTIEYTEPSTAAYAAPSNEITPYVRATATQDDNLFRLSDDERLAGLEESTPSDRWYQLEAGLRTRFYFGRQELALDAGVNENRFDKFDFLDYSGGQVRALADLQLGDLWSSELKYNYVKTLVNFAQFQDLIKDLRTENRVFGSVERRLTTRWSAQLGTEFLDTRFSERERNNRRTLSGIAGLVFESRAGNTAGIVTTYTNGEFPNRELGSGIDRGADDQFTQIQVETVADWTLSGVSRLELRAGYINRDDEQQSTEGGFSGPTGSLTYIWEPTGKTTIQASTWRELNALNSEIENFAVVSGVKLEPIWAITSKIALKGIASYEKRDLKGTNAFESRNDEVTDLGLAVEYQPLRNILVSLRYENTERGSTIPDAEYKDNLISGALEFAL